MQWPRSEHRSRATIEVYAAARIDAGLYFS